MKEYERILSNNSGTIDINWSTADGVVMIIRESASEQQSRLHFTVEQACNLTAVLIAACRTAGTDTDDLIPHSSEQLVVLAERLRADQKNLTSIDLREAAGYLELLLKFGTDRRTAAV